MPALQRLQKYRQVPTFPYGSRSARGAFQGPWRGARRPRRRLACFSGRDCAKAGRRIGDRTAESGHRNGGQRADGGGAIEADAVDAERFSGTRRQRTGTGRPCEPGGRTTPGPWTNAKARANGKAGAKSLVRGGGADVQPPAGTPGQVVHAAASSRTPPRHSGEGSWQIPAHGCPMGAIRRLQRGAPGPASGGRGAPHVSTEYRPDPLGAPLPCDPEVRTPRLEPGACGCRIAPR